MGGGLGHPAFLSALTKSISAKADSLWNLFSPLTPQPWSWPQMPYVWNPAKYLLSLPPISRSSQPPYGGIDGKYSSHHLTLLHDPQLYFPGQKAKLPDSSAKWGLTRHCPCAGSWPQCSTPSTGLESTGPFPLVPPTTTAQGLNQRLPTGGPWVYFVDFPLVLNVSKSGNFT